MFMIHQVKYNGNVEKLKIKNFNNFCYYIKKGVLEPTFKDIETGFKLASLSNFKNNQKFLQKHNKSRFLWLVNL